MYRRITFALVYVVVAALSPPAVGQGNGHGRGSETGQDNGNGGQGNNGNGNGNSGQGNNGQGNENNGNNGQGNAGGGNGNAGGGDANANAGSASPDAALVIPEPTASELSESDVLDAVQAGRAVPLATILPDIRARTGGEVIDARLEQVGDFLLYAVTVLTADGRVSTQYYYARSGLHVER